MTIGIYAPDGSFRATLNSIATGATAIRAQTDRNREIISALDFAADTSSWTAKVQAAAAWLKLQTLSASTGATVGAFPVSLHLGYGRQTLEDSVDFQKLNK